MLRLTLHFVLAANFAVSPVSQIQGQARVQLPQLPSALYEEGLKDSRAEVFTKAAIEKFEAAYYCAEEPAHPLQHRVMTTSASTTSEQQPDLLHNAKKALVEYVDVIEKDPTLGADPEEVKPVPAEIDAELERIRPPEVVPESEPPPPAPDPVDPGKSRRMLGIGLMSGGGALTIVGVAVGAAFASKGANLHDQLNGEGGIYDALEAGGCGPSVDQDAPGADIGGCDSLRSQREGLVGDGTRANGVAFRHDGRAWSACSSAARWRSPRASARLEWEDLAQRGARPSA